jgi:hypothetical protein
MTHIALGQKHDKWILIKGKVVDTFGYSIADARIALISKNGNDKSIKNTDSFGQFYFKLKKKNIENYALRCYFFNSSNTNKLVPVNDFIKTDEYIVGTNTFYSTKFYLNDYVSQYHSFKISIKCYPASKTYSDKKFWRNIPVDQTSPAEILKSQYSFLK